VLFASPAAGQERPSGWLLDRDWTVQSSSQVAEKGEVISTPSYQPSAWYVADMPSTVAAVLARNKIYPDPYFGMNLRSWPGVSYRIGSNFSNTPIPPDSPFRVAWWFRKQFTLPGDAGEHIFLNFDGINFRANVWLNGRLVADSKRVAGAYRLYEFDVTGNLDRNKPNVLALEMFAPEPTDLGITWVDWNPMPPDKNMGIWRDVYLTWTRGPVALRYPQVITRLETPSPGLAHLTVSAELRNLTSQPVKATLDGSLEKIRISKAVDLGPREIKTVTFTPEQFPQLNIKRPRLWWPVQMGSQDLYTLALEVRMQGKISEEDSILFGIREITSELNEFKCRVFKVNGQRVLIRGGGWAPDMMLRPSSRDRESAEIRYVKDMNLNTIRFEGKMETRRFLEMCDREGILVIAGWCCCDHWERWKNWDQEDLDISAESLKDQVLRLRNHPSMLTWWYGSDGPPPPDVEKKYVEVLKAFNWPNPYQSSATASPTPLEPTGLRMTGPYEYVPPVYWYVDKKRGGAYSFNTETSPGPAVPPAESIRLMLPKEHWWPIDEFWNFHAGGGGYANVNVFTEALNNRYGKAQSLEEYTHKAQAMTYEAERAMFEAYSRNKYESTGVIQWMMNNAWPSLIWHLYDYYLRPGGGYFGTKRACEPVHIQYSYDDASVAVVNSTRTDFKGLKATTKVYSLDMTEKLSREVSLDAVADSSKRVFTIPAIEDLTTVYFVKLELADAAGKPLSSNFYWLSTRPETLNEEKGNGRFTPIANFADFTGLNSLPKVDLTVSASVRPGPSEQTVRVSIANPGKSLAFLVRLRVTKGQGGEEILPVIWQDNYISLMPGEKREVAAAYDTRFLENAAPVVAIDGLNTVSKSVPAKK
jgi:exo-1,4-beta-D-glucosaminidase